MFLVQLFFEDAEGGFSKPANGKIVESTSNGLAYMPDADFCGFDSFTYEISSSEFSDSGTVTIHILCDAESAALTAMPTDNITEDTPKTHTSNAQLNKEITVLNENASLSPDEEAVENNGVKSGDEDGKHSLILQAHNEAGDDENSGNETIRTSAIVGAAALWVVAAVAIVGTWRFARNRNIVLEGDNSNEPGPWLKTVNSSDSTATQSVATRNISVTGLLPCEASSRGEKEPITSHVGDKRSSPEMEPISPSGSLFSSVSSMSKKSYIVDDVVDV